MADKRRTARLDPTQVDPPWARLDRDGEPDPPDWRGDSRETEVLPMSTQRGNPLTPSAHPAAPSQWEDTPVTRSPDSTHPFDAGRLWAGGAATALVAGLLAVVGILVARGLFGVAVLAPKGEGVWGNANTLTYSLVTAACALAATGLVQLLLATTPNATRFFGWIMVLLTLIAVVLPLSLDVSTQAKVFTAVLNLLIGLAITLLLRGVATSARRWADSASRGR